MTVEELRFVQFEDGRVSVLGDHWPEEVEFSRELLADGSPFLDVADGYIEVSVFNGCAVYEITGSRETVTARLHNGSIGFDP